MPTAYIALGSNLPSHAGSPAQTLTAAIAALAPLGTLMATSSFHQTDPVGYLNQPLFTNAVVALSTTLSPHPLLDSLLAIELSFGRDRSHGIPNGPRTLDLDLLALGDITLTSATLQLPHPRLAQRLFVLQPLAEIAPTLLLPGQSQTVAQLLQDILPRA